MFRLSPMIDLTDSPYITHSEKRNKRSRIDFTLQGSSKKHGDLHFVFSLNFICIDLLIFAQTLKEIDLEYKEIENIGADSLAQVLQNKTVICISFHCKK